MGLDMYLKESVYVHGKLKGENEVFAVNINNQKVSFKLDELSEIILLRGYWRKANAIHKWFIDNCNDGVDDCNPFPVTEENLLKLLSICKEVKENIALGPDLLPTTEGFFFGSTAYEDDYLCDLNDTIKIIEDLNLQKDIYRDFIYRASW